MLLLNTENATSTRTAVWSEIPQLSGGNKYKVQDIYSGKDLGCVKDQYSVDLDAHDVAVLKVTGKC